MKHSPLKVVYHVARFQSLYKNGLYHLEFQHEATTYILATFKMLHQYNYKDNLSRIIKLVCIATYVFLGDKSLLT